MRKQRRLEDAYRFIGFRPEPRVRGIFGDPKARIVRLLRRRKKRSVRPVGGGSLTASFYDQKPVAPRSFVRRHAGLPRARGSPRVLLALREVKPERLPGFRTFPSTPNGSRSSSAVAVEPLERSGEELARLEHGQGVGQAVHGRAIASPGRPPPRDRHRRNLHRQGTQVSHRGERSGPWPTDLVRRHGSSEKSLDEFFAWLGPQKCREIRLAVMDMWKPFRNSTLKAGNAPQATILYDKFHILKHLKGIGQGSQKRVRPPHGQGSAVHQRPEVHVVVAPGQPDARGAKSLKALFKANRRLNKAYLLKEMFSNCGTTSERCGRGDSSSVGSRSEVAATQAIREVRPDGRGTLGRHRVLLP